MSSRTRKDPATPLAHLLAKLVDHGLTEAEKARLEELLRSNPAAREYYRFYLATHLELTEEAPHMGFPAGNSTGFMRRMRFPLSIAAAVLFLMALLVWSPWQKAARDENAENVASVVVSENVRWSREAGAEVGLELDGGRIDLQAGTLALAFGGNRIVTLAAPVDFEVINGQEILIHRGNASLLVADDAPPFVMRVPRGTVVDLGTEFAVQVAADGTADVWVFEGKALVSSTHENSSSQQQALAAGQSIRIGETLMPSPLNAADFIRPKQPDGWLRDSAGDVIADFAADFPVSVLGPGQPFGGEERPETGWSYLWNPAGMIGDAASYQPLVPNTVNTFPAANGGGIVPMFTHLGDIAFNSSRQGNFQYGRIAATSIHPGRYVKGRDYRAIIAYTIQPGEEGKIAIVNSSLAKYRVDGAPTNGVDLDIFINDTRLPSLGKQDFESLEATPFDGSLGKLVAGDTVYIALGNNGDDGQGSNEIYDAYDACVIDFQLVRGP